MGTPPFNRKPSVKVFDVLFNTSSIHGIKYIADYHNPRATRTFWVGALFLSCLGCAYYAHAVYEKWYVTPDIGLKTNFKSARSVPFPSITVCPQNKIKTSFFNFSRAFQSAADGKFTGTSEERRYLEMTTPLCAQKFVDMIKDQSFTTHAELPGEEIISLMNETQYSINEAVIAIRFRNLFEFGVNRVFTSDGFCFNFNLIDFKDIFNEKILPADFDHFKNNENSSYDAFDGYRNNETSAYPHRIFSGAKNNFVALLVHYKDDIEPGCLGADTGFKVYWHMSNEIPMPWHRSIMLPPNSSQKIIMKATRVTTSKDLLRYDPAQRRCYFENEKKLQFFKNYTKSHCDLECLADFTIEKCGCVRFFMPHNSSIPVCNFTRQSCAENAEDNWLENDASYMHNRMPCECYPSCADIKYDLVMSDKSEFIAEDTIAAFLESDDFKNEFPGGEVSRLIVSFEDFLIEDQENYLGYKMQHFISDCGGLLGLFMGCSILSLVELVYNIVLSTFSKSSQDVSDERNRKPLTPMKDNRVIIVDDVDVVKID